MNIFVFTRQWPEPLAVLTPSDFPLGLPKVGDWMTLRIWRDKKHIETELVVYKVTYLVSRREIRIDTE